MAARGALRARTARAHVVAVLVAGVLVATVAGGCRKHIDLPASSETGGLTGATAVTTITSAAAEDDGQWTMPAKDYANTRFSKLAQINTGNVKDLRLVWTQKTGVEKGHEAAPLVVGDTMYVVTPYPNFLHAWDLNKPGSPPKWTYKPETVPAAQGVACCDVVNRGAAFWNGRIFYNTLDAQTVAVDATTGSEVWRTKLGDIDRGETITMAPIVVKGKVLVGNSGGEMGVRGWLTAVDAESGKVAWRAWATGPDKDVLIGPEFMPHYESEKGKDLGVTTWPVDQWKIGGGTAWGFVSYDPELDLVYYGTANPGPWNPEVRPGDNKWTAGVFARRPDTGQAKWFYQISPHDLYDHDGINENVLLDMTIDGKPRKVLVRADRNGYVYVMDRRTGEVLSAATFVYVNSSTGIDMKTGRMKAVEQRGVKTGKVTRDICPSSNGGKDWQPMSFSPKTGLLYIPHQNECMDEEGLEPNYIAGTPYVGVNVRFRAGPGGHRGELTAWDPVHAKAVWKLKEKFPVWSGTVVTEGDVVFFGTMDGWFKCVDAKSGAELWRFKTDSGIVSQPVTFKGPDGKQYVAVLDGVGGWAGAVVSGDLDVRDQSAALGMGHLMGDLKKVTKKGGAIYVFALP
jgi:PQQ-dependent dehydrogenase (methanol/ethanol family)